MTQPAAEQPAFRWLISQIGSREHYAAAVSVQRQGNLRFLYTDAWCPAIFRKIVSRLPRPVAGLSQRFHPELPSNRVVAFTPSTLSDELLYKFSGRAQTRAEVFHRFEAFGKGFGQKVAHHMRGQSLHPERDIHFAYSTGALESLQFAKGQGLITLVNQMDAARVHEELVREEISRWPNWETQQDSIPDSYFARLFAEWSIADRVVVNSEFSRRAIHRQGVPLEKIVVVPLAYESSATVPPGPKKFCGDRPLQVLFLGQVTVGKGIPYLMQAAEMLRDEHVSFTIVGPIRISEHARSTAPPNVRLVGPVLHQDTARYYQQADVFVLPTISDGFAITQIEAMAYGLPVIATTNCGDVVTEGIDGLIVPIRDAARLAAAIQLFKQNPDRMHAMSDAALKKSAQFTLARFAETLTRAVDAGTREIRRTPD